MRTKSPDVVVEDPPITISRDWRDEVGAWPHERWVRWRQLSTELLDGQDDEPTADDIRAADRMAYDLVRAEGSEGL